MLGWRLAALAAALYGLVRLRIPTASAFLAARHVAMIATEVGGWLVRPLAPEMIARLVKVFAVTAALPT
jgi:hypothetical protein